MRANSGRVMNGVSDFYRITDLGEVRGSPLAVEMLMFGEYVQRIANGRAVSHEFAHVAEVRKARHATRQKTEVSAPGLARALEQEPSKRSVGNPTVLVIERAAR